MNCVLSTHAGEEMSEGMERIQELKKESEWRMGCFMLAIRSRTFLSFLTSNRGKCPGRWLGTAGWKLDAVASTNLSCQAGQR